MKVLLISANQLKFPYPVYPLGLDYIADAVKASGRDVVIADMNEVGTYDELQALIRSVSPDVIGISLRNVDNIDVLQPQNFIIGYRELIDRIRNTSSASIVLGGSGFTLFPSEMMKALDADYGVVSEGEETFVRLLAALENKENASVIPGVITPQTTTHSHRPLNRLFRRSFNKDNPHVNFYLKQGGMLNLQTKRGCHYHCTYCTYPHIEGRQLRLVPPEDVAREALRLQEAGAAYFYITDSLFNSDDDHSVAVAKAFINAGVRIPWGAFFGPKPTSKDFYRIMADAGLTHVEFGTESLSDIMLESYKKPFRRQHVFEAHQAALDAGLYVAHFLMLGGPGESPETLNQTLSDVDNLNQSVLFIFCGIRIYPHTELFEIAVKQGQITDSQSLLEPVFYQPEAISIEELVRQVENRAAAHRNWVIGSEVKHIERILTRMYQQGYSGPLWEKLRKPI